jgi:hypothetical protein
MSQGNYGGGYTPPNPGNPYANVGGYGQAPPPKKSTAWIWILGIVGGGAILVCGCCGGIMYFGMGAAGTQLASMLKQQIQNDPVIVEQIGTLDEVTWSVFEVPALQESHKEIRGQMQAFKVKGPKGEGVVFGAQVNTPTPDRILESPILKKNGQEFPLKN